MLTNLNPHPNVVYIDNRKKPKGFIKEKPNYEINPKFVSIGADSKKHNLPEPSKEKIEALIRELSLFTEVKIKDNLRRLM